MAWTLVTSSATVNPSGGGRERDDGGQGGAGAGFVEVHTSDTGAADH
jgi:hypothetical protein